VVALRALEGEHHWYAFPWPLRQTPIRQALVGVDVRAAVALPVETQRLLIRAPQPSDADAIFALHSDADYIAFIGQEISRDTFDKIFSKELSGESPILALPIVDRATGRVVGECAIVPSTVREVELVVALLPDSRQKGYSSEAARAIIGTFLASERIDTVIACVEEDINPNARTLVERLGMVRDGVMPRAGKNPRRYEMRKHLDATAS
jgi:RimJ/RimL family protein N-acetyltransferase